MRRRLLQGAKKYVAKFKKMKSILPNLKYDTVSDGLFFNFETLFVLLGAPLVSASPCPGDVAGELLVVLREAVGVVDAEVEQHRRGDGVEQLGRQGQRRQRARRHAAPAKNLQHVTVKEWVSLLLGEFAWK